MTHQVVYAVVQFRPYRETEEFANVGVVLCAPKSGFFDYRIETSRFSRVTGFFSELDVKVPRTVAKIVGDELLRVKEIQLNQSSPEAKLRLFHEATKAKEGLIYFSQARPAMVDGDLAGYLEKLYQHYVHHSFAKQPSATEKLETAVRLLLEQNDLRRYYKAADLGDPMGLVKAKVPFIHQEDGRAIRPLSFIFGRPTPNKIVDEAEQWASRFKRLFGAGVLAPERVLVPIEFPSNENQALIPAINEVKRVFEEHAVRTIPAEDTDQLLSFAAKV
ncbi:MULTISPECIES: DUF3037 domain-containing protein [Aeromonas]|uniref:DUF3037 domain-containing protein n=1 Tax=Aeromonas TaxID=642 RepID=UPI0002806D04|nr:DUF3037 domain-containing protein [Aeromonas veronii]EKB22394.1 hypothetical protein HMPREF1170_02656 [Aeromonas veronii AMC35]